MRKTRVLLYILFILAILFTSCVSMRQEQEISEEEILSYQAASDAWSNLFGADIEPTIGQFSDISDSTFFIPPAYRGLAVSKLAFENGTDILPIVEALIDERIEDPYTYTLLCFVEEYGLYEHQQYSRIMDQIELKLFRNKIPQWLEREYAYLLFDYYYNRTGEMLKAEEIKEKLMLIEGWEILGPFSNVSGSGFKQDFIAIDNEGEIFPESVEGGLNNWVLEPFVPQCGNKELLFPLSSYLSSLNYSSAYAYKELNLKEEGAYHLVLSRKGSMECWVDGKKVWEDGSYKESVNALYIPLDLSAGSHSLVIKLNNREEGVFFNASLIPAEENLPESTFYDTLFPEKYYNPLLAELCRLTEEDDSAIEPWFWLYLTLLDRDYGEQAERVFSNLEHSESPLSSWLKALFFLNIGEWSDYDRDMIALGEKGILAPAVEYLLDYYASSGRIGTLEKYLKSLEGDRLSYFKTLANMRISMFYGKDDVMSYYYDLINRYPHTAEVHQTILDQDFIISYNEKDNFIGFLQQQGYYRTAQICKYRMHSYNSSQDFKALSNYIEQYPADEWAWIDYIHLLANHDDYGMVSSESRKAIGSFPYSYDLLDIEYDRSYWLYHSMKQYYDENRMKIVQAGTSGQSFVKEMEEEEEYYRIALEKLVNLYPYSLYIRDQLRELNGQETFIDNILHKYPVEYIQFYIDTGWDSGESDAVVVRDERTKAYFGDGSSWHETQRILKINTAQGVEDNRYYYLPFYVRRNDPRIREAFVYKADGSRVFAEITGYKVAFSGLEAGDYLIIRYNYNSYLEGDLNNEFWSSVSLSGQYPVFTSRYQMIYPEDLELQIQEHNLEPKMFKMDTGHFIEGYKKLEITSSRMEAVPYGIMTPSWRDVSPWIDISTVKSWETIVQWYDKLTRGQTEPSYRLKRTVESLCDGAATEREIIQRIFSFVSAGIEYEDLDFMYTAQIPQTADSVLKEGYGDCKDQTALLISMLNIAGIDAYFVLSSPGYNGGAPYQPSDRFSHVFAAIDIEDETLYLDPTTRSYTLGEVPASMKDTYILPIISGSELIPLEHNLEEHKSLVLMEFDNLLGTPRITGDFSLQGDLAGYYRYRLKGESEPLKQEIFQLMMNQWLPGFKLAELNLGNLDNLYYNPSAHFTGSAQTLLLPALSGGIRQLSLPWLNILDDVQHSWAALEGTGSGIDIEDYRTSSPVTQILLYHLPASGRVQALPRDQSFEFGDSYIRYSYKQDGNTLICTRDLWIQEKHIAQEDLEAFQGFLLQGLLKEEEKAFIRF